MPNRIDLEWVLSIGAAGALGGIVRQVLYPDHRVGLIGFLCAGMVGIFGGFVCVWMAQAMQLPEQWEFLFCSIGSFSSFAWLRGLLSWIDKQKASHYQINGQTQINHNYGENPAMSGGDFNINTTVHGNQQQNIGQQGGEVHQTNHGGTTAPDVAAIYDVITNAIPTSDQEAIEAANYLREQEQQAKPDQDTSEEAKQRQSLLAKYKGPILSALAEMGLTWLQAAYPQVVLVKPLIKFALDSLQADA